MCCLSSSNRISKFSYVPGATETEEVLTRFHSQKETLARLMMLRKNNEDEKKRLERHREKLAVEFEKLKYAEVQDTEQ